MARFISKYQKHRIWVQPKVEEAFANGGARLLQRELVALFKPDGLMTHEIEEALRRFTFRGTMQERNEVTAVSPLHRVSVFDSELAAKAERWTEEEHEQVLAFLRSDPGNGDSFFEMEKPAAKKPWATYDEMDAEAVVSFAIAGGFDPGLVHAYEAENEGREEVLHWALTGEMAEKVGAAVLSGPDDSNTDEDAPAGVTVDA